MSKPNPRPGAPNHDLLRARMEEYLSKDALARKAVVSSKAIRDIESGRVRRPHDETKARISKALGRPIVDLFPPDRDMV
jgi:transcriptional regulator with XRE-family HTH domain